MSTGAANNPISNPPFSSFSLMISAFPLLNLKCTLGFCSEKSAIISANREKLKNSPQPISISPESSFSVVSSFLVFSARDTISCALRFRSSPSLVRTMLWLLRSKSFTPSSSSSCISCLESVGCVTCKSCAAFVIFSSCDTIKK